MKIYNWGHSKPYNDYTSHIKKQFNERVQKISIDAGFTCPNRDGNKGVGGCIYCNNDTFNPFYCEPQKSVTRQLHEGIAFFAKKYASQQYLAYFQAYTNTYAPLHKLKALYEEALAVPQVIGLVISTRPDCITSEILGYLQLLAEKYYIVLELGVESTNNRTLQAINRGHSWEDSVAALKLAENRGIHTGIHLILGLPGESETDMLMHAANISKLKFETLKIHQLQIIKNTRLAMDYLQNKEKYNLFSSEAYINFICKFIETLNPDIIVERFISESPADLLIAPHWQRLKNFEIVAKIEKQLNELNTWQGKFYVND